MRHIKTLCVLLVLLLSISAMAEEAKPSAPAKEGGPVVPVIDEGGKVPDAPEQLQLSYRFEKGQTNRYQVQILNRGSYRLLNSKKEQSLDTNTEMFFRQYVKNVQDGQYDVEWALLSGVVNIPDFGQSTITLPEITYTMDESGTIKKVSGLEHLALLPGKPEQKTLATIFGQLSSKGFPKEAIKVGDEWVRDYTVPVGDTDKITAKVTYKLTGYEKCDGYNCATIVSKYDYPVKYEITEKADGKLKLEGKETGEITARFAYVEGKLIRSEAFIQTDAKVAKADGSGDAFVKLQINAVSHLLPPKKEEKEGS